MSTETNKPGNEEPIEFSEAQQKHINTIIDKRFAKVSANHAEEKKTIEEKLATANAELEELRAKAAGKKAKGEGEGEGEEGDRKKFKEILAAEENKRKLEEQKRLKAETDAKEAQSTVMTMKKQIAMQSAMGSDFVNNGDVTALTAHLVEFSTEHNRFIVKGDDGKPRENAKLEPMSLEEFYKDFGQKRPYLVRSDVVGGAGSTENSKSGSFQGTVRTKADLKTAKEKSDYIDKFGGEAFGKLPLK